VTLFAYKTIFGQCTTKSYEVFFQGYFADDHTCSWKDL